MRNILSLLALSLGLVACNAQNAGSAEADQQAYQNVDVKRAQEVIQEEDPLILDVRTDQEYKEGHIKDAKQLDFYGDNFQQQLEELPRDKPVLVYCHSGNRSGKTMARMKELGFEKVYNLQGGMSSWESEGKPVEQ